MKVLVIWLVSKPFAEEESTSTLMSINKCNNIKDLKKQTHFAPVYRNQEEMRSKVSEGLMKPFLKLWGFSNPQ